MKRMAYIVIALTSIVVMGVVFAGCANSPQKENKVQLTGLSISQNHMNFGYCYSFYLREEDDKVLFDADVRFDEEPYSIILEGCEIDKKYAEELRKLDKEYSVTEYVTNYKKKPSLFDVSDETTNRTTVYLSDGTDKTAETKEEYMDALYNFFFGLAKEYMNKSVYEE